MQQAQLRPNQPRTTTAAANASLFDRLQKNNVNAAMRTHFDNLSSSSSSSSTHNTTKQKRKTVRMPYVHG
jgi:hypothetical protein